MSDPGAAERLRWLVRHLSVWLLALVLLLLAVAVAVSYTYGVFTSSSANPSNLLTSGSMTQVSTADDEAILTGKDLVPGQSTTGSASITNAGDASGDFTLSGEALEDRPGPGGGTLSEVLTLRVVESPGGAVVYTGALADFDSVRLGTWKPDEKRTYDITVALPGSAGNSYQGSTASLTFAWDATQSH
ncbi:hypothetical protein [Nocardioides sp. URHA0020]|uniref:hypothetical protein n=1 Tax=Nocardioides sp. URHA0020 TaxID=1380392 RepID=UPI00048F7DF1|nr:hypothetical protein [Nocardioides sp. URHA0020]